MEKSGLEQDKFEDFTSQTHTQTHTHTHTHQSGVFGRLLNHPSVVFGLN